MTAREKVLLALGNCCAWCGSQESLELDHIAGGGNRHRQAIGTRLVSWLVQEHARTGHWWTGVQILCARCHDAKSGRRRTFMPARKGTTSIQVSIPDDLVARLTLLASRPGETKSTVMEAALRQLVEGGANQTLLEGLHQRLDTLTAAFTAVEQSTSALALQVQALEGRVTKQGGRYDEFVQAVGRLYDTEKAARHGAASPRLFRHLFPSKR